jgi:hypothetical protein
MISQTLHMSWEFLRQLTDTADTALADYTKAGFPDGDKGDKAWTRNTLINSIKIMMFGIGDEDATFSWALYSKPRIGPVELVANGTGVLGALSVVKDPITGTDTDALWADTLVITNDTWVQTVEITDSGNDRQAKISFDAIGSQKLYLEITGIGGEGQAESIAAIVGGVKG